MAAAVLYHIVSPVHLRNAALIQRALPEFSVVALLEEGAATVQDSDLQATALRAVDLRREPAETPWKLDVRAVVLSALQPRAPPLRILLQAARRGIPTVALEESHQFALNGGRVNNYLLPVHRLGVASNFERDALIGAGVPRDRIEVTGWPFLPDAVPRDAAEAHARTWGLDPRVPTVALALTRLNDAGETADVRRHLLRTAWQGLPEGWQLAIKTHPIERDGQLRPFVRECAPGAHIVPSQTPIEQVLAVCQAVVSRGASQVCFEALHFAVPSIVIDGGRITAFHEDAPAAVVRSPDELRERLANLSALDPSGPAYAKFRERHAPHSPARARSLACELIRQVAEVKPSPPADWVRLGLHLAFANLREESMDALSRATPSAQTTAMLQLAGGTATSEDVPHLLAVLENGLDRAAVRSLLALHLSSAGRRPAPEELAAMADWPPTANVPWYVAAAEAWAACLLRWGDRVAVELFAQRLEPLESEVPSLGRLAADLRRFHGRAMAPFAFSAVRFGRRAVRHVRRRFAAA